LPLAPPPPTQWSCYWQLMFLGFSWAWDSLWLYLRTWISIVPRLRPANVSKRSPKSGHCKPGSVFFI
jgi:hypothetical protein